MARRLNRSIVRMEIDNRQRGRVTGTIWLLNRPDPVKLSLSGNCLPDMAGCLMCFENPSPVPADDTGLAPLQLGCAGDMTASRKVIMTKDPSGMPTPEERKNPRTGNSVYIEWFSNSQGRIVIESAHYIVSLKESSWVMTREEGNAQAEANQQVMLDWAASLGGDGGMSIHRHMDEFEWEKSLKESDALTDRFSELMDKYIDHPDRDRLIAAEMGWTWLEEALDSREMDDLPDFSESSEDIPPPAEPDPTTEGIDWVRGEGGRITHPLTERAFQAAMAMWRHAKSLGLLGNEPDEDVHAMIFEAQTLSVKLAGSLDGLARDRDVEGGFVVACLKRALQYVNGAFRASQTVAAKGLISNNRLESFRQELFAIREEMLRLMAQYRQKQW
jgi:hypothetical protein